MPYNNGAPWDFFLSHKQTECGRPAALICRDLEKAGKQVWLDVNMENCDTDAMLEGVQHSHNFVLMLSDGYFASKFCCMELRHALKLGKRVILCHAEGWNVGAALQAAPDEFAEIGKQTSIQLIVSDPEFRRLVVQKIIKKSAEPIEVQVQQISIEASPPRPQPTQPIQKPSPAAPPKTPRPSDQAISRLFAKAGGSLEEALERTSIDWSCKGLDDEDAKVVAYVVASSAVLETL